MGFFTLELARLVGPCGRVIAVDVAPEMIEGLRLRARKAGMLDRIDTRIAQPASLGLTALHQAVDFAFAPRRIRPASWWHTSRGAAG